MPVRGLISFVGHANSRKPVRRSLITSERPRLHIYPRRNFDTSTRVRCICNLDKEPKKPLNITPVRDTGIRCIPFLLPLFVTFQDPLPRKKASAKARNSFLVSHKPAKVEQRVNLDWSWPSVTFCTRILDRNLCLVLTGICSTTMRILLLSSSLGLSWHLQPRKGQGCQADFTPRFNRLISCDRDSQVSGSVRLMRLFTDYEALGWYVFGTDCSDGL